MTTAKANTNPMLNESVRLTNSPQCLHFLPSANISSAQNEHFRGPTLARAVALTPEDVCFSPSKLVESRTSVSSRESDRGHGRPETSGFAQQSPEKPRPIEAGLGPAHPARESSDVYGVLESSTGIVDAKLVKTSLRITIDSWSTAHQTPPPCPEGGSRSEFEHHPSAVAEIVLIVGAGQWIRVPGKNIVKLGGADGNVL
jgi:hypothetical protein